MFVYSLKSPILKRAAPPCCVAIELQRSYFSLQGSAWQLQACQPYQTFWKHKRTRKCPIRVETVNTMTEKNGTLRNSLSPLEEEETQLRNFDNGQARRGWPRVSRRESVTPNKGDLRMRNAREYTKVGGKTKMPKGGRAVGQTLSDSDTEGHPPYTPQPTSALPADPDAFLVCFGVITYVSFARRVSRPAI